MWTRFRNEDLVFTLQNLGTFYINGKPHTAMPLLGAGLLADASGNPTDTCMQLQIPAQICAALNRCVMETPASWHVQNAHRPAGQASNWCSKFWHVRGINRKAYGFAYDDVGDFSASIHTSAPTVATYTISWKTHRALREPVPRCGPSLKAISACGCARPAASSRSTAPGRAASPRSRLRR
jgi:hypothetical protein